MRSRNMVQFVHAAQAPVAAILLALAVAIPAQAATVSATGALDLTITGPDNPVIGSVAPISIGVTNTTASPTGSFGAVQFFVPVGSQLSGGAINNSTGAVCARLGGGGASGVLVNCPLASLAPGASATIGFGVIPQSLGTLDLSAAAVDGFTITSAELIMPIAPAPTDVQITGFASTGSPTLGSTYTYTFQVKDNGAWPAPAVVFADTIPASLTYVAVSSTIGSCSQAAGTVSCAFGDMTVGAQANVVITVQAPSTAQTIMDVASVSMGVTDRQASNDSVAVAVQVK